MKTFVQMLFNVAMMTVLVVLALNQHKASNAQRNELMNELRPLKEEMRKVNGEIERACGEALRQQAAIEKVEAALRLRMTSNSGRDTRTTAPVPGDGKPALPSIDNAAVKDLAGEVALTLSQPALASAVAMAGAAAQPAVAEKGPSAPSPVEVAPATVPSTDVPSRKTLVFSSTSTGTSVREIIEEPAVLKPQAAKPAETAADISSTGFPDFAALVSTSTVRSGATAVGPAKQASASGARPGAIDRALPGGAYVPAGTSVVVRAPAPATNRSPVIPKRVTSVPSTTAAPEPGVPPVRKSALGLEHEREGGSVYPLSISDRMLGSSKRQKAAKPAPQPVESGNTLQAPATNAQPADATEQPVNNPNL